MADRDRVRFALDVLFVAGVTLLAAGFRLTDLGFHSDDWAFVAELELVQDPSFSAELAAVRSHDGAVRPLQFVLLALVHRGFGADPLPYHLVQFALVVLAAVLLFLVLRKLRLPDAWALAVAVVWAVLPHHSSARLWVAAAQVPLAAVAYLAHVLADLRAAERTGRAAAGWRAASGAAALASLLSYELFLPFILATPFLTTWWRARAAPAQRTRFAVAAAPAFAAAALALAAKAMWASRLPTMGWLLRVLRGGRHYLEIAAEHATVYGLGAPLTVARAAASVPAAALAHAALAGVLTFAYLALRAGPRRAPTSGPAGDAAARPARPARVGPFTLSGTWPEPGSLVLAGLLAHLGGYGVAFLTGGFGAGATGVNNRTAMAAAVGVALVVCGLAGLLARRMGRRGDVAFAGVVALVVAASGVVDAAITRSWVAAARSQEELVARIQRALPDPDGVDNLLIAGVCRFDGAGIVVESPWGVGGVLRLAYRTSAISGDVVGPETRVDGSALRTEIYRDPTRYPFEGLYGYDDSSGEVLALRDSAAASAFLRSAAEARESLGCAGRPGRGAPVF